VAPSGIVEAFVLPKRIVAKSNPKDPARSRLVAAGIFDTGPELVDLSAAATLEVGGLSVSVPGLTRKGKRFLLAERGLTFLVKPARTGSSKALFRMKLLGDPVAADPASELTIRFRNAAVDGLGTVRLAGGRYALRRVRGALIAPTLYLFQLRARLAGAGRDALALRIGLATNGTTPAVPPDLTISLGDGYAVTIPSASFTRQGDRFVAAGTDGGVPSAVLDYGRELLTIRARKIDLGTFVEGAQPLEVTVSLGTDSRTNRVRAVKRGKALRY
jgi:hypothetical protein